MILLAGVALNAFQQKSVLALVTLYVGLVYTVCAVKIKTFEEQLISLLCFAIFQNEDV